MSFERDSTWAVAQTTPRRGDLEGNLAQHLRLAEGAAEAGAELVLFPELSLTTYHREFQPDEALDAGEPRLEPLAEAARRLRLSLLAGAPVAAPGGGLHIGALLYSPEGEPQIYRKQFVHRSEKPCFRCGPGGPTIPVAGETVASSICADLTYPEHAQAAAEAGATVYAAGCFLTPEGWEVDAGLLRGYAGTYGMLVLMANFGNSTPAFETAGRSAAWAPGGELLACAPESGEALLLARHRSGRWTGEVRIAEA